MQHSVGLTPIDEDEEETFSSVSTHLNCVLRHLIVAVEVRGHLCWLDYRSHSVDHAHQS
jgi:hypothetical protein